MGSASWWRRWLRNLGEILFFIALGLVIRFYVFQPFVVNGGSMCPTLNQYGEECRMSKGETVFLNAFVYTFLHTPERGDIVVFQPPGEDAYMQRRILGMPLRVKKYYIKRVIGLPGDTITLRNGQVYLTNSVYQDVQLTESYLSERNAGHTQAYGKDTFVVPEGHYMVMGDNRAKSQDSRMCFSSRCTEGSEAFVPEERIQGRAEAVMWPLGRLRGFSTPSMGL